MGTVPGMRVLSKAAVWVALAVLGCLAGCSVSRGAEPGQAEPSPGTVQTVALEFQTLPFPHGVQNLQLVLENRALPIEKEPQVGKGKVFRGRLGIGPDAGNRLNYRWDLDTGTLRLDLNDNLDLTDDTNGVYQRLGTHPPSYQTFAGVHLPQPKASSLPPVLVDIHLYSYGSQPNGTASMRSFWSGKVTIHNEDWQVGLVPDLNRSGSLNEGSMLFRPWDQRAQPFSTQGSQPDTVRFSRNVFVAGQAFDLALAAAPAPGAAPSLRFTPASPVFGGLNITGQFVERLTLEGDSYKVFLSRPGPASRIPVGRYGRTRVLLKSGSAQASRDQSNPDLKVVVAADRSAVLAVGGPITNSVSVSRQGKNLQLGYQLIGASGDKYTLSSQDRSKPPEFAVYRGDQRIHSGKFEFG